MYRIAAVFIALNFFSLSAFSQSQFTWSEDIACIVYSHCTNCHNSEGIAPFSFESYDDVAAWKDKIMIEAIVNKTMPPWTAKGPHNGFIGDYTLSDAELFALENWLQNDLPVGDLNNAPAVPTFETNIEITDPDYVIDLPEYTVPNLSDNDLYKCYVFPIDFGEDVFVKGIEVIPGNLKAVHHVLFYYDPGNTAIELDAQSPEEGYACFGGIGTDEAQLVGGWAPGGSAQFFPENMGVKLPAQANIVIQVHYPFYAHGEVDQTSIRLELTNEPQRELYVIPILNHFLSIVDGPLYIPANTEKTFNQNFDLFGDITIVGTAPHAHLICNQMETWAETPDGEIIELATIPNWDFDWQKFYAYKRPIILKSGTKIKGRATYDNTVNNHHNPNFPPEDVWVGEATGDEMMVFFFTFTGYQEGDEDLVFDPSDHSDHAGDCGFLTSDEDVYVDDVKIFPIPSNDYVYIESTEAILNVRLTDMTGKIVIDMDRLNSGRLNIKALTAGTYALQVQTEERRVSKLIVKE